MALSPYFISSTVLASGGLTTSYSKLLDRNPDAGNALFVVVHGGGSGGINWTLTDNYGDNFVQNVNDGYTQVWVAINVHGGATTLSFSGPYNELCEGLAAEYTNVASVRGVEPLRDPNPGYLCTGSGPITWTQNAPFLTLNNGDTALAWFQSESYMATFTPGSGYALRAVGGVSYTVLEDQTFATAGTQAAPTIASSATGSGDAGVVVLSSVPAIPSCILAASVSGISTNPASLTAYNQAAGNCIVICTASYTGGGYATGISDTAGNTFVPVYAGGYFQGTGNMCCQIWYARNCLGNAANVVQIAYAGGAPAYAGAFYYDISGADLAAPMDAVFPGSVGGPNINVLAGLTTNFANELLIAFLGGNAGASLGYSVGSLTEHATFAANPLTGSSIPSGFTTLTGTWACDPTCGAYATALNANGFAALCDNTQTWAGAPDQSSEGVFTAASGASSWVQAPGIGVRLSATSGYFLGHDATYITLWKYVAGGVPYRPGSTPYANVGYTQGSEYSLSIAGNKITVYHSGVPVFMQSESADGTWTDTGTGSDAPITSGAPGLVTQIVGSPTTDTIDNWVGTGPVTAQIPVYLDSPSTWEHAVDCAQLTSKLDASSLLSLPFTSAYVATLTGITIKALPAPTGYTVSGTILDANGNPISGATVSCTGQADTSTSGTGTYSFASLANGSYTITPSLAGYTFVFTASPPQAYAGETVSGADITGVDFAGTQAPLATPTFSPVAGSYGPTQSVSFTSANATGFFYTTDGITTPTHTGATPGTNTTYVAAGTPVSVAVTETLKVLAYDSTATYADSSVATAAYTISGGPTAIPIVSSMQVQSGATLDVASGGVINATEINGVPIPSANSGTAGKIPIAQGDGSAAWADPLVQGTYAPGSNTGTAFGGSPINPVLIGGSDYTGTPLLQDLKVNASGQIEIGNSLTVSGTVTANISGSISNTSFIATQGTGSNLHMVVDSGTVTADQGTSPWVTADEHITATLNQDGFGNVGVNIDNSITGTVDVGTVSGTVTVVPQVSPPVSFPVSGTVTANQGTATASAKWSVQVDNASAIAVSGTVSTTPPSHASTNVDQWNGNTVDTNSGNKSGGTLRVVLATDQPNLTTALNVHDPSPSSVAVTNTGTFAVQAAISGSISNTSFIATQGTAANLLAQVSNNGTFATQDSNLSGAISASKVNVNISSGSIANTSFIATSGTAANLLAQVSNNGTFAVQAACTGTVSANCTQTTSPWVVSNAGTFATQDSNLSGAISASKVNVNISSGSIGNTSFTVTQATGTNLHCVLDTTSTTAVTQATAANLNCSAVITDGSHPITAAVSAIGVAATGTYLQNVNSIPTASTAGGATLFTTQALTTKINLVAAPAKLLSYALSNPNATVAYVSFYNTATTPAAVNTTGATLLWEIMIPIGGAANFNFGDIGAAFSAGIAVSVQTTESGGAAPTTGVTVSIQYK